MKQRSTVSKTSKKTFTVWTILLRTAAQNSNAFAYFANRKIAHSFCFDENYERNFQRPHTMAEIIFVILCALPFAIHVPHFTRRITHHMFPECDFNCVAHIFHTLLSELRIVVCDCGSTTAQSSLPLNGVVVAAAVICSLWNTCTTFVWSGHQIVHFWINGCEAEFMYIHMEITNAIQTSVPPVYVEANIYTVILRTILTWTKKKQQQLK